MDLVETLSKELAIEPAEAESMAGALLVLVEDLARERVSYGLAARVRDAVPELLHWQTSAPTLAPGMLSLDDVGPGAAPGSDETEFQLIFKRFNVAPAKAAGVPKVLRSFLGSRLEHSIVDTLVGALPWLGR